MRKPCKAAAPGTISRKVYDFLKAQPSTREEVFAALSDEKKASVQSAITSLTDSGYLSEINGSYWLNFRLHGDGSIIWICDKCNRLQLGEDGLGDKVCPPCQAGKVSKPKVRSKARSVYGWDEPLSNKYLQQPSRAL